MDELAKVEALLVRIRRGETLPADQQEWALERLRDFLITERVDFGESP